MSRINIHKILTKDKSLLLAYDQGMEHGPKDLDINSIDPKYVFDIALEGMYDGIITGHGIAEKYYHGYYRDVPLIVKLNGKTSMQNLAPISRQLCSVDRAAKLGASAIGYTLYPGSPLEPEMFAEFSKVVEQAHDYGLPVIGWMYPRGQGIDERNTDVLAYSARAGLELGADFLKMKYNNDPEGFKWVVKCAGRAKVLASDIIKTNEADILRQTETMMKTGITGIVADKNVWQHKFPYAITKALRKIVFESKTSQEAEAVYEADIHKQK